MEFILNLRAKEDLPKICRIPINEILVQTRKFSRFGGLDENEIQECLSELKKHGKKIILAWDILARDHDIVQRAATLNRIIKAVDAIRFLDPGIGMYVKDKFPDCKFHLSLEHGSFNQNAILRWLDIFSPNLQRIILSNQIPVSFIKSISAKIDIEVEIPGACQIEMFYSARTLSRQRYFQNKKGDADFTVFSEDRPDQMSRVVTNEKGTILFYDKDLFILDEMEVIQSSGINILRLELYTSHQYNILEETALKPGWIEAFKKAWPTKTTKGFLLSNKTHEHFIYLTNRILRGEKENKIGVVIESAKNMYTLINIQKELYIPDVFLFLSPEGREVTIRIERMKDLNGQEFKGFIPMGYYLLPWIKHTVASTLILRKQSTL